MRTAPGSLGAALAVPVLLSRRPSEQRRRFDSLATTGVVVFVDDVVSAAS
jgi:hypothetical protein